jgi:F5/8 type C domain
MNADENDVAPRSGAWWRLSIALAAVFLSRLAVLHSSFWAEVPYEPAPLGLEALAVLRGDTPALYWGQPYFGTFFSYVLAPFYALGAEPVQTFGWVAIGVAVCGAAAIYWFARRLWGELAGLAALAYLAVPSAYYSYHTLTAYAVFQALGSIACFAALVQLVDRPVHPRWIWLCGLALGASTWCQQLGLYYAVAVGMTFLAVERRRVFGAAGLRLAAGFFVGSAPLWIWNALFDWITVRNFLTSDYAPLSVLSAWSGFWESAGSLVAATPQFWLDQGGYAAWMRYGQLLVAGLVVFGVEQWIRGRRREQRVGAGLLLTLFGVTAFFYAKSRWGVSPTYARYIMPLATVVPILVGGAVATAARRSRMLAVAVVLFALLPGVHDHLRYARWSAARSDGGAPVAIAALDRLGITRAYAHNRISLPINLASRERIIVSDYYGVPYMPYLNVVDDDPAPAIIAHETLQIPHPTEVARSLGVLGGHFRRLKAGPYWIFYAFKPPDGGGGWLSPAGWKLAAVAERGALATLVDRDVLSGWSTNRPQAAGDWLSVDLGKTHAIDEVHLLSAIRVRDIPKAAVLETSLDGEAWTARSHFDGLNWYWWNGHPKLDDEGRVSFYFDPVLARHLRVRLLDGSPNWNWSVSEIFVRAIDVPEHRDGEADFRTGLLAERRGFVGISYHSLHAPYAPAVDSTPWGEAARAYARAARKSPDDPEPLYRLGRVLWMKNFFGGGPDRGNALGFEALGLEDLAATEFRRCAVVDAGSFCVDHVLRHPTDEAERARLLEVRRRFEPADKLAVDLGAVELVGRGTLPERIEAGGHFTLELFWKCLRPLDRDLVVFVHAVGPAEARFAADHPPARGAVPTSRWQPGETIRDAVEVTVPPAIPQGRYTLRAGLWDPARHSRLRRDRNDPGVVEVGSVEVVAPPIAPAPSSAGR